MADEQPDFVWSKPVPDEPAEALRKLREFIRKAWAGELPEQQMKRKVSHGTKVEKCK